MISFILQTAFPEILNNYYLGVTLGGYDLLGMLLMLIFFGFIIWRFRINLTSGILIITTLLYNIWILTNQWFTFISGIIVFVLIGLGYLIIRYLNR